MMYLRVHRYLILAEPMTDKQELVSTLYYCSVFQYLVKFSFHMPLLVF